MRQRVKTFYKDFYENFEDMSTTPNYDVLDTKINDFIEANDITVRNVDISTSTTSMNHSIVHHCVMTILYTED